MVAVIVLSVAVDGLPVVLPFLLFVDIVREEDKEEEEEDADSVDICFKGDALLMMDFFI